MKKITLFASILFLATACSQPDPNLVQVSGSAMNPTLYNGQYISIDRSPKSWDRGDIIVFKYPKDPSQWFIKRIVGLPGEQILIKNEHVWINGNQLDESPYLGQKAETYGPKKPLVINDGEYYVLGDNRTASSDSRIWGTVPKNLIVGKFLKIEPTQTESTK